MAGRNVLVAGASGLVGMAAVRHFVQQAGCEVTAVSRRVTTGLAGANLLSIDLLDRDRCREVFGGMAEVTHLVYAAVNEKPGALVEGWSDREQMQANLRMLENVFEPLEAAAKNLQHVTLLQGTKAYGAHLGPIPIPARERSPRHLHQNFYWLQEDYLRAKQKGKDWAWTILRPQLVIGDAIGSNLNLIPALGVYAALLREAGEPLHYPGDAGSVVSELVDVELLARAIDWSGSTSASRNEIFNITHGDVFSMREIWPTIAGALGMEVGEDRPMLLAAEMPKRAAEWAAIVEKYKLAAPADVQAFVGESFTVADFYLNAGGIGGAAARPVLVSTIKARQAGFHDCIDTDDMLESWFRRLQDARLLPPLS
jgi:nucleoside-diphosphate-sugar epimerase